VYDVLTYETRELKICNIIQNEISKKKKKKPTPKIIHTYYPIIKIWRKIIMRTSKSKYLMSNSIEVSKSHMNTILYRYSAPDFFLRNNRIAEVWIVGGKT